MGILPKKWLSPMKNPLEQLVKSAQVMGKKTEGHIAHKMCKAS
jgi:hypothetical protein